ncbi:MAG: hypothetical protein IKM42_04185, partial [Clostridia bacterium]|nr:hypothetical protein [Clostridia bacterium]
MPKKQWKCLNYLEGSLPYDKTASKKYYAGPTNYLQKQNNQFCNMLSGEKISLSQEEIQTFSQQARASVTNQAAAKYNTDTIDFSFSTSKADTSRNTAEKSAVPPIDEEDLIVPETLDTAHLIANYRFFRKNPEIGNNNGTIVGNGNKGTCGPVAAQLLLGYVNYFSDRRIIPDRFLNGFDDASGTIIDESDNPNTCEDPMYMDSQTTGTSSSNTGVNSFYLEMISRIMEPNSEGSTFEDVYDGITAYLGTRLSSSEYVLNYEERGWVFGYTPINSAPIIAEIEAGRPLIIGMDDNLNGADHFVVAYGYQSYTYPDGSGTYTGYIAHYGYPNDYTFNKHYTCVWINSAWCDGYLTLKSNHTHYYTPIGTIPNTNRIEYFCYSCGHRTDAAICMSLADRYAESVMTLGENEHKDYYLCFKGEGVKLIQTLGQKDTKLELYDAEYNIIASSEDEGFEANALISYYLFANTGYILRVISHDNTTSNAIKLIIVPAYGVSAANSYITDFEDIYSVTNILRYTLNTFAQPEYVRVITFDPRLSLYYN